MKTFLKTALACALGVIIAILVLGRLAIIILSGIMAFSNIAYTPKPHTIFKLELNGKLTERSYNNFYNLLWGEETSVLGLDDILSAIKKAKNNSNIDGIYMTINNLSAGYASLSEIRDELADFKQKGKFIICYADNYRQSEYYLASVADEVYLNPMGRIDLSGITSEHIFYKDVLDKLGIGIQVFRVGTFKSAVEPFINTQMSEANRAQTQQYISSIWNDVLTKISETRNIPTKTLNQYADSLLIFQPAQKIKSIRLVDNLNYQSQIENRLKFLTFTETNKDLNIATLSDMVSSENEVQSEKNKIAVVYATGEIDGIDEDNNINSQEIVSIFNDIQKDRNIKGVVLRINSPGGSLFGSEQIWAAIERLKTEKIVVASMSDYAASGGYYIACNSNRIFAQPTTITGSIGIFGIIPEAENLLTKKLGFTFDEVKTNKYGNFPSLHKKMNESEKAFFQREIENGYQQFIERCAWGRKITSDSISKIAEGRVWTGTDALQLGLIDELGGLSAAISWIAQEIELSQFELIEYPQKKTFLEELSLNMGENVKARLIRSWIGETGLHLKTVKQIKDIYPIQARMETFVLK